MAKAMTKTERYNFAGSGRVLDGRAYVVVAGVWRRELGPDAGARANAEQTRLLDAMLSSPPPMAMPRELRKHHMGRVLSTSTMRSFIVTSGGGWCLAGSSGDPTAQELIELDAALAAHHAKLSAPSPIQADLPRCAVTGCDARANPLKSASGTLCTEHAGAWLSGPRQNNVDHPAHYGGSDDPFEVIKVLEAWQSPEEHRGFLEGNVIKYLARAKKKNNDEDRRKAAWYAERLKQFIAKPESKT